MKASAVGACMSASLHGSHRHVKGLVKSEVGIYLAAKGNEKLTAAFAVQTSFWGM
jgi:hypothetical protein